MNRWIYHTILVFLFGGFLITLPDDSRASGYYSELKQIEANNLNGNQQLAEKLNSIGVKFDEFNDAEKDLYNLLVAHLNYMQSELDTAEKGLKELIDTTQSDNIKARANATLAGVQYIMGKNVDSFISLDQAIKLLPAVDDEEYKFRILQNIVAIYKDTELFEYALSFARRLKAESEKLKDHHSLCQANYELGTIELFVNNKELAKQRLLLAKQHCSKVNNQVFLLAAENYIALIERKDSKIKESIGRLEKILPSAEKLGWGILIAAINVNLAEGYLASGNVKLAKKFGLEAYTAAKNSSDKKRLEEACSALAQVFTKTGEKEKALKYYNEFRKLNSDNKVRIRQRKLAFDIARRGKL